MKRIERDGYLEVVLSEIETHREQGEALDIELFRPEKFRRTRLRMATLTGFLVVGGWMVYVFVIGYGVLRAIGAL